MNQNSRTSDSSNFKNNLTALTNLSYRDTFHREKDLNLQPASQNMFVGL